MHTYIRTSNKYFCIQIVNKSEKISKNNLLIGILISFKLTIFSFLGKFYDILYIKMISLFTGTIFYVNILAI